MKNPSFPMKEMLILVAVCTVCLILAIVIGLLTKGSSSSKNPTYIIEQEKVAK